jgi:hypothetical protein
VSDSAHRKGRRGKGLFPPNPKQWGNERNGLDLRSALGCPLDSALPHESAFALLPNVTVLPHGELLVAQEHIDYFRGVRAGSWSGMAVPFDDGSVLVLYNDAHPVTRTRATLMEEFFHLRLGHPPTKVRVYQNENGGRSHDPEIESAAYGSGAAALVPYAPLKKMVESGTPVSGVAGNFEVSPALVRFRLKVTFLYRKLRRGR